MRGLFPIIILVLLAGCDWQFGQSNLPPHRPVRISEEQSKQMIVELPQTVEFARNFMSQTAGEGKVQTRVFMYPEATSTVGEDPYWLIDIIQQHAESTGLWQRFKVNEISGEISVWDSKTDEYMALEQWQGSSQMATTLPATTSAPASEPAGDTEPSAASLPAESKPAAATRSAPGRSPIIIYKTEIGDWDDSPRRADSRPVSSRATTSKSSSSSSRPADSPGWRLPTSK